LVECGAMQDAPPTSSASALHPVDGFVFAETVLSRFPDDGVEKLLDFANGCECDWLEKKAGLYVWDKDPDLETTSKTHLDAKLRSTIADAILAFRNWRGGVILVGIKDSPGNETVPLRENDPKGFLGESDHPDFDKYIRQAFQDRVWSEKTPEGRWNAKSFVGDDCCWTLERPPSEDSPPFQIKPVRFRNETILAVLVPPRPEGSSIETIRKETRAETVDLVPRRRKNGGQIDRTPLKDERQRSSYLLDRTERLRCSDLSAELFRLGIELAVTTSVFSSVDSPRAMYFVGRDKDLGAIRRLLGKGKFPIVTGPGGVGKSELLFQFANRYKTDYPGGLFQINMEGISSWDAAFQKMLKKRRVRECLGFEDRRHGNQKIPDIESMREALAHRVDRFGRVLLVLDNVDPSACKSLFKPLVLDRLNLPMDVYATASARASYCEFPNDIPCVEYPLADLSPETALNLLLRAHPAKNEQELESAKDVARLLGYRILYLRAIPALMDDVDSGFGKTYGDLASDLEGNLSGTVGAGMEGDDERTPSMLWNWTKDMLARSFRGSDCIKLAECASFFSSEGFRVCILRNLWIDGTAPNSFDQALFKLEKFGILEKFDDRVRMHRLTRFAIRRSALDADSDIDDRMGRTLTRCKNMEKDDWLDLADSLKILQHIPEEMLDGDLCVSILVRNQDYSRFCKWNKLLEPDWLRLLSSCPRFVRELESFAKIGVSTAQNAFACALDDGVGIKQDRTEAEQWFHKAIERGHVPASTCLGEFHLQLIHYTNGWWEKGGPRGVQLRQPVVPKDRKAFGAAMKCFRFAANQGDARGRILLGRMMELYGGNPKKLKEACKWYRLAAEQGDAEGQYEWGRMLFLGLGVNKNLEESIKWTRLSAEQGNLNSQYHLAVLYARGDDVPRDLAEAAKWFQLAAEKGDSESAVILGTMFEKGRGVKQSLADAVKWYRRAAEQGNSNGQWQLATMYQFGLGVEQNNADASKWYRLSAGQGNDFALAWLGGCYLHGIGSIRNVAEAKRYLSEISDVTSAFNAVSWQLFEAKQAEAGLPFAKMAVERVLSEDDSSLDRKIMVFDTLAATLDALARADETKKVCSEILSLLSDDDDSNYREVALVRLGRACQRLGDKTGAADAWSKALEIVEKHGGKHAEYGESADELRRLIRESGRADA